MTPGDGRGVEMQKWADELQDLLAEGVRALRSGDVGKVADVQGKLRVFKERSPDYADSLDRVATLAILDLDLQATEMAVERIEQRSAEVDRLAKLIRGVSKEARSDAAALRLERAREVVESSTAIVDRLKRLRESLGRSESHKELHDDILDLIEKIQALRNKVEVVL